MRWIHSYCCLEVLPIGTMTAPRHLRPRHFGISCYALLVVLLLLAAGCCEAKVKEGSAHLTGEKTENTLSKFALSPFAQGKVVLELHSKDMYVDETGLRMHMYHDSDWPRVKKAPTCAEKVRLAKKAVPISFELNNNPSKEKLDRHKKSKSKERGLWESRVKTSIPGFSTDRPQYWYLTLDDCSLEVYLHDNQAPQIEYTLTILDEVSGTQVNQDVFKDKAEYRHTPADENGMSRLHFITALVSFVLFLLIGYKIFTSIQTGGSVHAALLIMAITALCDGFSSVFELSHLAIYENNGIGSYSLDALSTHFEAMSDSLVALVLLSVGSGWTLPSDVLSSGGASSSSGFLNNLVCGLRNPASALTGGPAGMLAIGIIVAHASLAQWGRTYDEDFDVYHSLENPPGRALMYFRISLGLAFLVGVASIRNGGRCPASLLPFLTKFAIVGISWFISLPFLSTFVASTLPYHRRHQAISAGSAFAQSCSIASLAWMFAADSDASAYHRLSKVQGKGDDLTDMASTRSGHSAKTWRFGKTKVRLD